MNGRNIKLLWILVCSGDTEWHKSSDIRLFSSNVLFGNRSASGFVWWILHYKVYWYMVTNYQETLSFRVVFSLTSICLRSVWLGNSINSQCPNGMLEEAEPQLYTVGGEICSPQNPWAAICLCTSRHMLCGLTLPGLYSMYLHIHTLTPIDTNITCTHTQIQRPFCGSTSTVGNNTKAQGQTVHSMQRWMHMAEAETPSACMND